QIKLKDGAAEGGSHSSTLKLGQFWEIIRDSGLISRHALLWHIDQAVHAALSPSALVATRRKKLEESGRWTASPPHASMCHCPDAEILFPQFCESLVRIAQMKYRHLGSLEKRVHSLLNNDVLPISADRNRRVVGARGRDADAELIT
ncbi:unnamed protein product, partial [Ostreobium quekettii]